MTRKVILIFGQAGTGKTYLARTLVDRMDRVIILDPMFEFSGTILTTFDSFADYLLEHQEDSRLRIVCRFTDEIDTKYFFHLVRQFRNFTLVVDEMEMFLDPRSINPDFSWIISFGRHNAISMLGVGRRIPELSPALRAQATTMISFRQTLPGDLAHLGEYGFDPERVRTLPDRQYLTVGNPP